MIKEVGWRSMMGQMGWVVSHTITCIAGTWVAFCQECQKSSCGQGCREECPEPDMAALTAEYEQKVMDRAAAPERQWHTGVYSTLCSEHIMPHDVEILEAFGNTLPTLPCAPSRHPLVCCS